MGWLERLKTEWRTTALAPVLVLWFFGYTLVDIFAWLQGRTHLGLNMLSSPPLLVLGVVYTLMLDRLRLKLAPSHPLVRLSALGVALIAIALLHSLTDLYWNRWLALTVFPDWQAWALTINRQRLFVVLLLYLWTFCLALTLLWAARIGIDAQQSAERADEAEAASNRAEAAALRLQLNPHFLFNTLNSISSLVTLDRKEEAEQMIGELSDFLRASLVSDPTADVALGDELGTIEAYLNIEGTRFGDRLIVDIDVPDALLDLKVPNFILQPLVENAIKHGVAPTRLRTTISITAEQQFDDLLLSVINRTEGLSAQAMQERGSTSGTGIGASPTSVSVSRSPTANGPRSKPNASIRVIGR